jgi:hypothetical protein
VLELALFLPLLLLFGLACIQFAVIFMAYLNVMNATRDAARWVSVHPHVIDSTTTTTVKASGRLPTGLNSGALTLAYTPTCTALNTNGKCAGRDTGTEITVTSTYTITSHLFLPSSFGWGSMTIAIPQTLPTYAIHMQVEPS